MESNESFSDKQTDVLAKYVTNTDGNIFVLRNLPEVIKGALFSKYSRSSLGLRELLLKEFIQNEDTAFSKIAKTDTSAAEEQLVAIKRAQNFYDRILDGFGDDSIGELGGAHLATENVSILAAKAIEDLRIGGSPLEKSTRYIYFDQKIDGDYLYYKEPILMTSAYRELFLNTCKMLFDTYSQLIPKVTEMVQKDFPKEDNLSTIAYKAALRAKVLDLLRGLLPASSLTNLGVFGNGRFFENLIKKLSTHNLAEMQNIAKQSYTELSKVIPSFVKRADPNSKYQISYAKFVEKIKDKLKVLSSKVSSEEKSKDKINLINFDPDSVSKVVAALLFENSKVSLKNLQEHAKNLSSEEVIRIFEGLSSSRENRRHKSPRALEHAFFTFEITADFGMYRDLQRHRMLTQERQILTCDNGYFLPKELKDTDLEKDYVNAMNLAKKAYDTIAKELPEEAQYVVPMAYNVHWYFNINLRSLQWLAELRSSPAGHPNYRYVAQEMVKQVIKVFPEFECFFKFVDFEGYDLGRINQEVKRVEKQRVLK